MVGNLALHLTGTCAGVAPRVVTLLVPTLTTLTGSVLEADQGADPDRRAYNHGSHAAKHGGGERRCPFCRVLVLYPSLP